MNRFSELSFLGWSEFFEAQWLMLDMQDVVPARVTRGDRGSFMIALGEGREARAVARGRLTEWPAVGDWVIARPADETSFVLEGQLERRTVLQRVMVGSFAETQVLAANLDLVLIATSINQDFNIRRLERFVATALAGGVQPIVVLTKSDLVPDPNPFLDAARESARRYTVLAVSSLTGHGLSEMREQLGEKTTLALVGSSGVGKSSLVNALLGQNTQVVSEIRTGDDKGRHTTTSRQLLWRSGGGAIIDTPGLRELQLWQAEDGVGELFEDVEQLALTCKFTDCTHKAEPACAVQAALKSGVLAADRWASYQKLKAEAAYQARKVDKSLASQEKQKWKQVSKEIKAKTRR